MGKMSDADKDKLLINSISRSLEKDHPGEYRQLEFDNYQTTDDHGMLITGTAKDQDGNPYFLVKNSWGLKLVLIKDTLCIRTLCPTKNHGYHGKYKSNTKKKSGKSSGCK